MHQHCSPTPVPRIGPVRTAVDLPDESTYKKRQGMFLKLKSLFMPKPQIPKIDVRSMRSGYGGDTPSCVLLVFHTGKPGWVTQAQAGPLPSYMAGGTSLPLKCSGVALPPRLTRAPDSTLWVGSGHLSGGSLVGGRVLGKERDIIKRDCVQFIHSLVCSFHHSINIYFLLGTCWALMSFGSYFFFYKTRWDDFGVSLPLCSFIILPPNCCCS